MQRHRSSNSRVSLYLLFSFALLLSPKVSAQIEPSTDSTPTQTSAQEPARPPQSTPTTTSSPDTLAPIHVQAAKLTVGEDSEAPVLVESIKVDAVPRGQTPAQEPDAVEEGAEEGAIANKPADNTSENLEILGTSISPGESRRLLWVAGETTYGSKLETPVYVIRGKHPGLTLCLTAAIHGDELNGVEIIRQLVSDLSPKKLYGTVIGVPIVNLLGFTRGTRYLPDRRDLNRYFPGNPDGSSASRIAFSFFQNIVSHCDLLVDLHTGSLSRTNMPQVRANLQIPEVLKLTTKFGSTAVLHSRKLRGNLRSAATNAGIPAVALELGEPGTLQPEHVEEGVEIIENVLNGLKMTRRLWTVGESQPVFYSSRWVRVNTGGLLITKVEVGERIWAGDVLGSMVNPITNESFDVVSPYSGRVLGMALNQFMLPGYAAFNVGIVADQKGVVDDAQSFECINSQMEPDQVAEEFGCAPEGDEEAENEDMDSADLNLGADEGEEGS